MKWLKRIFLSMSILGIICLSGYIVYNVAHAIGEKVGYESGYSVGQKVGYSSGKQDGYEVGKTDGYSLGKQDGREEGYISGKADGYEEGIEASLGHGYTLRDLTYKQAITFLREDKTDKNKYIKDTYVCSHYARDVCNNAEAQGFRCAFVSIRFPEVGHSIIAFNTIDKELVYFDSQTDERVKPVIGKRYYQCVEPRPGFYYEKPSYDDTIMDILIIW